MVMKIDAQNYADEDGTILYDAGVVPEIAHAWFTPAYWRDAGLLRGHGGGRAAACFIETPVGACVLRHYHRGGMMARWLGDRYVWSGHDGTRGVAEFRLTTKLLEMGLPVPVPLATRYQRRGVFYTADLITHRIAGASTLAECLHAKSLDTALAEAVGALVARFHRVGVWHADLNAHNVMVGENQLYLIDFDRGQIRAPAWAWQQANLNRLRRSLLKLGAQGSVDGSFEQMIWVPLLATYRRNLTV